jgi:hypothetical protein
LKNFIVFFEADFPVATASPATSRVELRAVFPLDVTVLPPSFTADTTDLTCDLVVDATDLVPFCTSEATDLPADKAESEADLAVLTTDLPVDWTALARDLVPETPLSTVFDTVFFAFLNMIASQEACARGARYQG